MPHLYKLGVYNLPSGGLEQGIRPKIGTVSWCVGSAVTSKTELRASKPIEECCLLEEPDLGKEKFAGQALKTREKIKNSTNLSDSRQQVAALKLKVL